MANSLCLTEAAAQNAAALNQNGNGGSLKEIANVLRHNNGAIPQDGSTTYQLQFLSSEETQLTPYPPENPIISIVGCGDISFIMGDLEGAAYCLSGMGYHYDTNIGSQIAWEKGRQFYATNCISGTSNIAIYDAQDRLIRQIEITNCGSMNLITDTHIRLRPC